MKRQLSIFNDVYHVVNSGVGDMDIFRSNKDKDYFCKLVEKNADKYNITIYAYAIMDNHFHFSVKIPDFTVFSNFMRDVCAPYARYFNRTEITIKNGIKKKRHGAVFAESYKSVPVNSLWQHMILFNYIHNNPRPLINSPEDYIWSSFNDYMSLHYAKIDYIKRNYNIKVDMSYFNSITFESFMELMKYNKDIVFNEGELQSDKYMTDSVLISEMKNVFDISGSEIRSMDIDTRNKWLFKLKQIPGTYVRQIARVTGLTYNTVRKGIKNFEQSVKDPYILETIKKNVFNTLKEYSLQKSM